MGAAAALVGLLLQAGSVLFPITDGNALTLPSQRHLVRIDPGDGRAPVQLTAIQQGGVDSHGLCFWRSDDEGVSWSYYAPIQPDASHTDRVDLVPVGRDIALVWSYETFASSLSGSSLHDV